MTPRISAH